MIKKGKLLYKSTIGSEERTSRITWLGNGRVGIPHHNGHQDDLIVVNASTGEELWRHGGYKDVLGNNVPLSDERAIYTPLFRQTCAALDLETGADLWGRMGIGEYSQVQTKAHIALFDTMSSALTIIDKKGGNLLCYVNIPHPFGDYLPMLRAARDRVIVLRTDNEAHQCAIDLYDPAIEGCFVKTIARYPNKGESEEILSKIVIDDALYFFTDKGYFCKLDLTSGEIVDRHRLPDPRYYYISTCCYLHFYDGRLCAIAAQFDGDGYDYALTYNPANGRFEWNNNTFSGGSSCVQFYKDSAWRLSDKGLTRFSILGDGSISCVELEDWKNNIPDWTDGISSENGNCWLIADNKLLAMPQSESKPTAASGVLHCWDLSDCFND